MDNGAAGAALLVLFATVSGAIWHTRWTDDLKASSLSAITAALLWTVVVLVLQEKRDPLIVIAFLFAMFWSFVIAWLMGLGFRWHRSRAHE